MTYLTIGLLSIMLSSSCAVKNQREGELYNLPTDFRGVVVIIYDQKDGADEKYYDPKTPDGMKLRVYDIPESGILKTKFPPNYGELPTEAVRVFYNFFDESKRREIKISSHDFVDEGNDILKAQAFHYGEYCYPDPVSYTSFEVGSRLDFVNEEGKELAKWKGYVFKMIEKYTGITCEQEAKEGGKKENIKFPW